MQDTVLQSGWETLLVAVPSVGILLVGLFRLVDFPNPARVAFPGVKVPEDASIKKVNLNGYLFPGRRALFGLVRAAPAASVGIGEKQASIPIATAGRAFDGLAAFGRGDQFIQPEETH